MPIEKPHIPPERKLVSEYPTPTPSVVIFTELVNRTDPAYQQNAPMMRGQLYSDIVGASMLVIAQYPTLYFLRERKFGTSDQLVLWDWATVPQAEDAYNAEVNYVSNAVPYPAFTRVYTIRRDVYDASPALSIGSTLTGIIGVKITQGGGGYTSAHGVIDGTDVDIQFVVSEGVIISGVILNEGTGVTSSDTIRIMGDGEGCVAVPIVQSTACYLTSQKKQELGDDPLKNEFVRVIRVYETLPGPFIATTRIDPDGKVVTINTRRNIAANIVSSETLIAGQWCKTTKKGDDNFVGEEGVECRAVPGNPVVSTKVEEDGKILTITKTLKDTTLITSQEQLIGGNWVRTYKEEVSDLVANEIVESRPIPGNVITESKLEASGDPVTLKRQMVDATTVITSETVSGSHVWIKKYGKSISDLVSWQIEEDIQLPGVFVDSTRFRSDGSPILITKRLQEISLITPGGNIAGGFLTLTRIGEVSDLVAEEIKEISLVPGPTIHGEHIDQKYGLVIDIEKTIVPDGTEGGIIAGAYVEIKPHDEWQSIQISSKLDPASLPEDVQWFDSVRHSFEPELRDAIIDWALATCGCSFSFSAVLIANIDQISGECKTRVTEQFYNGVPPDDVTIAQFFPQSHHFGFAWASTCGSSDGSCRTKSGAPEFHIPLCLHDDLTLSVGTNVWHFPATVPAALPHGTYIMLAPKIERWRFGVFRRVLTEVLVP